MFRIIINLFIFLLLQTITLYSDVIFEMEYKHSDSQKADKTISFIKNNLLKMDFFAGGTEPSSSIIFRSDKQEMITLDHKEKSYFIMDKDSMNQFSGQMNTTIAQMEEAMKDMTPEEREMMKKMMKDNIPNITDKSQYTEPVLKNAGSASINGYTCTKYDVFKGSEKTRQYCVTDWSKINGGDEIKNTMLKMSDFMEEFRKSFSSGPEIFESSIEFERNIFLQISKLNGFPVQTVDYYNDSVSAVSTFSLSKKANVDANTFEPPADYKEQKIGM